MSDLAKMDATLRRICPLYAYVDLSVESMCDGLYRCRVPLNQANANHLNTVHAAIQWAAAEMLGGLVAMRIIGSDQITTKHVAIQSVSIDFKRPARSAIIAEAKFDESEARLLEQKINNKKDVTFRLSASVRSETGETVAVTKAVYVVRPLRPAKFES